MIWGLWLGLSVMGGASVYFYPLFALTMFVVPAVWAAMAFRTRPVMLIVAGALVFLFGYLMGFAPLNCLCILGLAMPAGAFLWYCQRERMGNFRSVMYVSVLLTFGMFLVFCVPDLLATGDPYASVRTSFAASVPLFEGTPLYEAAQAMVSRIGEMMIACFFAFAAVYALVNVLLLHAFNKIKKEMPLCPLGPFGTWMASYRYVMILGGAGLAATILMLAADTPAISALSLLLYEMWALPLLFSGVNFLYYALNRRLPKSRANLVFGVAMAVSLLFMYQFFQMALLLLGLIGVIRRRRAGKVRQ